MGVRGARAPGPLWIRYCKHILGEKVDYIHYVDIDHKTLYTSNPTNYRILHTHGSVATGAKAVLEIYYCGYTSVAQAHSTTHIKLILTQIVEED